MIWLLLFSWMHFILIMQMGQRNHRLLCEKRRIICGMQPLRSCGCRDGSEVIRISFWMRKVRNLWNHWKKKTADGNLFEKKHFGEDLSAVNVIKLGKRKGDRLWNKRKIRYHNKRMKILDLKSFKEHRNSMNGISFPMRKPILKK